MFPRAALSQHGEISPRPSLILLKAGLTHSLRKSQVDGHLQNLTTRTPLAGGILLENLPNPILT